MARGDSLAKNLRPSPGAPLDLALVRERLGSARLGSKFHYFQEVGSTSSHARALAENGAAEGEVVIAESQIQGRGRLGRRWESPPLANLYFSIVLRPTLPPAHAAQITLMAAVALAECVGTLIPQPPAIKWPNDILVQGKKLAGILTEACCDTARVDYVILGVGMNVNLGVEAMPETIRQRATSLSVLSGENLSREKVLSGLIQHLDRCYGILEASGFEALRPRWEAYFNLGGRRVRAESGDQAVIGVARGIDPRGALLVEDESGALRTIIAGDVIPLES
jgi:BirA family biotin operon repressor/biotin-[acetyl-CoA-carboxylase] ligase